VTTIPSQNLIRQIDIKTIQPPISVVQQPQVDVHQLLRIPHLPTTPVTVQQQQQQQQQQQPQPQPQHP
jgi:hypothetical protein